MAEPASAEKKIAFSVKDFASQFQKATTLSHKRHIVDRLFEVHPDIKPLVPVHVLEGWTDRRAGLELIAAARAPLSFFDRIAFSRQLAAVESGIRKTVRGAVRMILSPERKGRKFPEILFGKLAPFMRRNDQMVAEKILAALHGLSPRHPVKRLYGSLIRNVHKALAIDREVKKEGIREETIRRVVTQHGESLSHRGMREAVQNLFFLDPRYADFHKLLKEVLGNILHDESFTGPVPTADESTAALLRELAGVRDLESFVWKAAGMKEAGGEYAAEVERLFDLLLHEPLVNIYKLIKFPLNAELFHRWLREGPIPSGLSDELERKIAAVKADREKGVGRSVSGTDYADFARLYYTLDIGFTDKYKLVADTASSGADPAAGRFVMDQIKNVQFKIEQKFIGVLVKELSVRRSFSEIDEFLELVRKKLDLRIADYATAFKKNIEALAHKNQGVTDRYTPLFSLLKYIAEGKMVSVDALLALDAKVNPDRNLMFIARLASSLVDFYFLHNSRLILRYMKEYLAGLAATDGVALKKRMSTVTREEIYGVMATYRAEPDAVRAELAKYRTWCELERVHREKALRRLARADGEKDSPGEELSAPAAVGGSTGHLSGERYGKRVTLRLTGEDGKVRFERTLSGIATFLDFAHTVERFRLHKHLSRDRRMLKIVYQEIHLQAVRDIEIYIAERERLVNFTDSLLTLGSEGMSHRIEHAPNREDAAAHLLERGAQEMELRTRLVAELEAETVRDDFPEERRERAARECASQKEALNRLSRLCSYLDRFAKTDEDGRPLTEKAVDTYLAGHRAAANNAYLSAQRARMLPEKLTRYLASFPRAEEAAPNCVCPEEKPAQVLIDELSEYALRNTVSSIVDRFLEMKDAAEGEREERSLYIAAHEAHRGKEALLYRREVGFQMQRMSELDRLLGWLEKEIDQYERIDQLNRAAGEQFRAISDQVTETDPDARNEKLVQRISALKTEEERTGTAARFFLTEDEPVVKASMEAVVKAGRVNRYKILIALYRVLDAQEDMEVKLKILDEFSAFLAARSPELFEVLKPLLDIQREKIEELRHKREVRISDFFRTLDELPGRTERISYIDTLRASPEWALYHSYLSNIREGLLAENVAEFFSRSRTRPPGEQRELLLKLKLLRTDAYRTTEIDEQLSRKEYELEARLAVLHGRDTALLNDEQLRLLATPGTEEEAAVEKIHLRIREEEETAVRKHFQARKIPTAEIEKYLSTEFPPRHDRSFDGQKKVGAHTTSEAADTTDADGSHAPIPDAVTAETKMVETAAETHEPSPVIPEEKPLPREAARQAVHQQSGRDDVPVDYERRAPEKRSGRTAPTRDARNVETNAPAVSGTARLVEALAGLTLPTRIEEFGRSFEFEDDEIARLVKTLPELAEGGRFVYAPAAGVVLGKGMLKGLIGRAFNERLSRKAPSVDARLLKEIWDGMMKHIPPEKRPGVVGAASPEEVMEIGRELEELLRPEGIMGRSDPRKKLARMNTRQTEKKEASGTTSAERERRGTAQRDRRRRSVRAAPRSEARSSARTQHRAPAGRASAGKNDRLSETNARFIERMYAPLISGYIKRLYKKKGDFFVPLQGRQHYYNREMLENAVLGILRKDASGRRHDDLLDAVKRDQKLLSQVIASLFTAVKTGNGQVYYFPKFLKGGLPVH